MAGCCLLEQVTEKNKKTLAVLADLWNIFLKHDPPLFFFLTGDPSNPNPSMLKYFMFAILSQQGVVRYQMERSHTLHGHIRNGSGLWSVSQHYSILRDGR